jgi:crossover junction endodeoxyribonuclease RuvC
VRVLGIDPGLRLTGYACIDFGVINRPVVIEAGVFRLSAKLAVVERLVELAGDLRELIARTKPDRAAVEMLYAHYKHPTTAIVMGHARGVIFLTLAEAGLEITELRPTMVKKAATGFGHAGKDQMQRAMQTFLKLKELPTPADVADAMAIAVTASRR